MQVARGNVPRALATLALSLAALSCDSGPQARLEVGFDAHDDYASADVLEAWVAQDGNGWLLGPLSMKSHQTSSGHYTASTGSMSLEPGKEVTVGFTISATSGARPTETVTFTPREDWEYGVTAVIDTLRPVGLCVHVTKVHPLPAIGSGAADTLFILEAGLPRGAIC